MRFSRWNLRRVSCAGVLAGLLGAGCGNSCFVGGFNGTGFIFKGQNPCGAVTAGKMSVFAGKTARCENCAAATRVDHVYVTVRGVQLRSSAGTPTNSSDSIELAGQLANQPRQIDLMADSAPESLAADASVPMGTYVGVQIRFLSGSSEMGDQLPNENACGEGTWNCIVTADQKRWPIVWRNGQAEMEIPFQDLPEHLLATLPNSSVGLQLDLEPQLAVVSGTEGWQVRATLKGKVELASRTAVSASANRD
jgi:Domain of unknown function (DUF4382)